MDVLNKQRTEVHGAKKQIVRCYLNLRGSISADKTKSQTIEGLKAYLKGCLRLWLMQRFWILIMISKIVFSRCDPLWSEPESLKSFVVIYQRGCFKCFGISKHPCSKQSSYFWIWSKVFLTWNGVLNFKWFCVFFFPFQHTCSSFKDALKSSLWIAPSVL